MPYNVEIYLKIYNVYLTSETIYHKHYGYLQLLLIPIYLTKNLTINFLNRLSNLTN